jgi:hypothetical protein
MSRRFAEVYKEEYGEEMIIVDIYDEECKTN